MNAPHLVLTILAILALATGCSREPTSSRQATITPKDIIDAAEAPAPAEAAATDEKSALASDQPVTEAAGRAESREQSEIDASAKTPIPPVELGAAELSASVTYIYPSLPKYAESGQVGVITQTFRMQIPKKTSEELAQMPAQVAAWRAAPDEMIHFGESMRDPLFASIGAVQDKADRTNAEQEQEKAEGETKKETAADVTECPAVYQDVAYRVDDSGKSPIRVLAYGGCPFLAKSLEVEKRITLRTPAVLEVVGEAGNVLRLAKGSALPFLTNDDDLVYLCSNAVGVTWQFPHAGIRLDFADASYVVTEAGATISYTEKGVVMEGVRKIDVP